MFAADSCCRGLQARYTRPNPCMRRFLRTICFFVLMVALLPASALAQASPPSDAGAQKLPATTVPVFAAQAFGDQVDVNQDWLFHPGDDPGYASPTLDDRNWLPIDLHKSLASYGFSGLRYGWLRVHVHLPSHPRDLALGDGRTLGRYQVFANGVLLGSVGNMSRHDLYDRAFITAFPIPAQVLGGGQDLVLAYRFSLQLATYTGSQPEAPFVLGNVVLGTPRSLGEANTAHSLLNFAPYALNAAPAFITALAALALFLSLRDRREYAWLAGWALLDSILSLEQLASWITPYTTGIIAVEVLLESLLPIALFEFIRETLGIRRTRLVLALEVLPFFGYVPALWWATGHIRYDATAFNTPFLFTVYATAAFLLFRAARTGSLDARLILPGLIPMLLAQVRDITYSLREQLNPTAVLSRWVHIGPFELEPDTIADILLEISLLLFLIVRTVRIARERNRAASELEAARAMQQVLVPETIPDTPGLSIETAYHPAQEVGGDFFQVLPLPSGATVVVIGDVAGKGMPAALTVSLIVGALRTLANYTDAPAEILAGLNDRLLGRGQGFTTCLALRFSAERAALTVANAGHLPPYRNGHELETETNLPLGLALDISFPETTYTLHEGDHLAVLTDGVPEAMHGHELFGFGRTGELSRESAHRIAAAAQQFGQADDITVLTVDIVAQPALMPQAVEPVWQPA